VCDTESALGKNLKESLLLGVLSCYWKIWTKSQNVHARFCRQIVEASRDWLTSFGVQVNFLASPMKRKDCFQLAPKNGDRNILIGAAPWNVKARNWTSLQNFTQSTRFVNNFLKLEADNKNRFSCLFWCKHAWNLLLYIWDSLRHGNKSCVLWTPCSKSQKVFFCK
jgi:hypothetical protein